VSSADEHGLRVAVDNLDRALAQAPQILAEAVVAASSDRAPGNGQPPRQALRDRVEAARDLDLALGDVASQVGKLLDATKRADSTFTAALAGERQASSIGRPLGADAVADALLRRLHALGSSTLLDLRFPTWRRASTTWPMKSAGRTGAPS